MFAANYFYSPAQDFQSTRDRLLANRDLDRDFNPQFVLKFVDP
jgi:hypothetical protein